MITWIRMAILLFCNNSSKISFFKHSLFPFFFLILSLPRLSFTSLSFPLLFSHLFPFLSTSFYLFHSFLSHLISSRLFLPLPSPFSSFLCIPPLPSLLLPLLSLPLLHSFFNCLSFIFLLRCVHSSPYVHSPALYIHKHIYMRSRDHR